MSKSRMMSSACSEVSRVSNASTRTLGLRSRMRSVADSSSLRTAEFSSSFVLLEYFGYLRRNPDPSGYNFWLNKLNAFNGNFVNAEMVKAFISSSEYRRRFGP